MDLLFIPRIRLRPIFLKPNRMKIGFLASWPFIILQVMQYLFKKIVETFIGTISLSFLLLIFLTFVLHVGHIPAAIIIAVVNLIMEQLHIPFFGEFTFPKLSESKVIGGRSERLRIR